MNGIAEHVLIEVKYVVKEKVVIGPHHGYVGRVIITPNGVVYGVYYWHNEEQKFIECYDYELSPE